MKTLIPKRPQVWFIKSGKRKKKVLNKIG